MNYSPELTRRTTIRVRFAAFWIALLIGCSNEKPPALTTAAEPAAGEMQAGLDARYRGNDPFTAIEKFRIVLEKNPDHYGATYQLASALDAAGRPAEARPFWLRALELAGQFRDEETARTARERLARSDEPTDEALMNLGLRELHALGDARAAAGRFRQVLQRQPDHYGATYQLAVALDAIGDRAGARAHWERVVVMAQQSNDAASLEVARKRLEN